MKGALFALAILALAGASLADTQLRAMDITISGGNCTNIPVVVTTKDYIRGDALRTEVRFQISYWGGIWNDIHTDYTDATTGSLNYTLPQEGIYLVSVNRAGYLPYSYTLNASFCPLCRSDSECRNFEACTNYTCTNVTQGVCGFVANHTWYAYECCEDSVCADNEQCANHTCTQVTGACGFASGHTWHAYTCCVDLDCGVDETCTNHACVAKAECAGDSDCMDSQRCAEGVCLNLTGECGYASGHAWHAYQCCSDAACPSGWCLENRTCSPTPRPQVTPTPAPPQPAICTPVTAVLMLVAVVIVALLVLLLVKLSKKG